MTTDTSGGAMGFAESSMGVWERLRTPASNLQLVHKPTVEDFQRKQVERAEKAVASRAARIILIEPLLNLNPCHRAPALKARRRHHLQMRRVEDPAGVLRPVAFDYKLSKNIDVSHIGHT